MSSNVELTIGNDAAEAVVSYAPVGPGTEDEAVGVEVIVRVVLAWQPGHTVSDLKRLAIRASRDALWHVSNETAR